MRASNSEVIDGLFLFIKRMKEKAVRSALPHFKRLPEETIFEIALLATCSWFCAKNILLVRL